MVVLYLIRETNENIKQVFLLFAKPTFVILIIFVVTKPIFVIKL